MLFNSKHLITCCLFFLICSHVSILAQTEHRKQLELIRLRLENRFEWVGDFDSTSLLAGFSDKERRGYIDTSGKELHLHITGTIYSFYPFVQGLALVQTYTTNSKKVFYLINRKGNIEQRLTNIESVREWGKWNNVDRIIAADVNGKHGVIDRKGKVIIPFKYYLLETIDRNHMVAYVGENGHFKVGVINFKDSSIVPAVYDQLYYFNPKAGYLLVCKGKDVIAMQGQKVYYAKNAFPRYYPEPSRVQVNFENGLILNKTHETHILYDLKLDTVTTITGKYDNIEFIYKTLIGVSNWQHKELDTSGRMVSATGLNFSIVTKDGKVITPMFTGTATPFVEGLSRVTISRDKKGYTGFMNENGLLLIPCVYDRATDFRNGFAKVQKDDKVFLIDKWGNVVMDVKPF